MPSKFIFFRRHGEITKITKVYIYTLALDLNGRFYAVMTLKSPRRIKRLETSKTTGVNSTGRIKVEDSSEKKIRIFS